MRTLIAWTLTLAVGASASGQGTAPAAKKTNPPLAIKPAPGQAAPVDPKATKAKVQLDPALARQEMERVLVEWERRSKQVTSLDVLFDRIDRSGPAWGDNFYQGRAMLQSPDLACLQFQKYKLDKDGKPLFVTNKDGKKVPSLEATPFERIVCTGSEVLQYSWDEKKIFVFPLDKQQRQKALQQGPLPFLFNMKAAEAKKRYSMTLMDQDDKDYLIAIVPNEQIDKDSFSKAFLWLSKRRSCRTSSGSAGGGEGTAGVPVPGQLEHDPGQPAAGLQSSSAFTRMIEGWKVIENPGGGDGPPNAQRRPGRRPAAPPRRQAAQQGANPATEPVASKPAVPLGPIGPTPGPRDVPLEFDEGRRAGL